MDIIIGKFSGFCQGVNFTILKANRYLESSDTIYCLGEIVHNERVIHDLEEKGMISVSSIEEVPDHSKVIFRAHGEQKKIYDRASQKNLEVLDLTCGKILSIRNKIQKEKENSYIVIIGKKNHPETIGTYSYAGSHAIVLEDLEDIPLLLEDYAKSGLQRIYIVAQTTFSSSKFGLMVEEIKRVGFDNLVIDKTICDATEKRQKETEELSLNVDKMIIVGSCNSSNTTELYNIAKKNLDDVFLVQDKEDLDRNQFLETDTVGIMAGASTPLIVVSEIVDLLEKLF